MRAVLGLCGLALAVLAAYFLSIMIAASGIFVRLEPKLIDQCRRVDIFPGTEDVTIDPELGLAFISADDRRATMAGKPVEGGIYALKLDGSDRVSRVSPDNFSDFHPHGISLWNGADGGKRLFVVNHSLKNGDRVEIFDVGFGGLLLHVDSVSFPEMLFPNDVVSIGPRSFYVTNDRGFKGGVMGALESYLALPFSSLAYYDGQSGSIAAEGLVYANGVNISANGKSVYVSELLRRRISVFTRDPATNVLTKSKTLAVNTSPDNIEVDEHGGLWVAGHSRIFDFLKHAEDPLARAPSHVIHINPATGERENALIDVQGVINGSSAAAAYGDTLVVGAVFDDHVMICPLSAQ